MSMLLSRWAGAPICRVPGTWLHGLWAELEKQLRAGVAVQHLQGLLAYQQESMSTQPTPTPAAERRASLQWQIKDKSKQARNFRAAVADADTDTDRRRWQAEEHAATRALDELRRLLADVEHPVPDQAHPTGATFNSEVSIVLAAIGTLLASTGRQRFEDNDRIRSIVRDERIEVTPAAGLRGTARVLLPSERGVAMLGPLSWDIDRPALTPEVLLASREAAGEKLPSWEQGYFVVVAAASGAGHDIVRDSLTISRDNLIAGIAAQRVSQPRALQALNAPFPQLAHLLTDRADSDIAAWAAPDWVDPAWREHVRATYHQPSENRVWSRMPWQPQALHDVARRAGGTLTRRSMLAQLAGNGVLPESVHRRSAGARNIGERHPVLPSFTRDGRWQRSRLDDSDTLAVRRCHRCDGDDLVWLQCPEIAGGWICATCRALALAHHLPDAETLLGLTVPADYLLMRIPERVWRASEQRRALPPGVSPVEHHPFYDRSKRAKPTSTDGGPADPACEVGARDGAVIVGISETTLLKYCYEGKIGYRLCRGRLVLSRPELVAFAARRAGAASAPAGHRAQSDTAERISPGGGPT